MTRKTTQKIILLIILGMFFPMFLVAQTGRASHKLPANRLSDVPGLKSLTSSSLTSTNNYIPGATMDLTFSFTFTSPDTEYLDGFSMTFPAGMTPNQTGTSDPLFTENGCAGAYINLLTPVSGQTLSWGELVTPSGCGALVPGYTYNFTVNVTIDAGVTGTQTVNYTAYGDGYGATPHTSSSSCTIVLAPANDVGVLSVDMNLAYTAGSIVPMATVQNLGSNAQNNFNVQMKINSSPAYDQTVLVTSSLAAGATMQVAFPVWTAPLGNWTATAKTLLAGDLNPLNDSLQKNVNILTAASSAFCFMNNTQPAKFYLEAPGLGFDLLGASTSWYSRGGAYVATGPGTYSWYVLSADFDLYSVDTVTGVTTLVGSTGLTPTFMPGLTYDKTTSTLFAGALTGAYPGFTFALYTINLTTGAATLVANSPTTGTFIDIACNATGQLYAIEHQETGNGRFYSLDKTTAALTLIGTDMGVVISSNFQDIEFAPDGYLYYAASTTTAGEMDGLYTVNTTTGLPTLLGAFPVAQTQIVGLGIRSAYDPLTSIDENNENNLSVFPNPATNKISVVSKNKDIIRNVKVFSLSGQLVYEENVNFIATTLNTGNYDTGYYYVQVLTDNGLYTDKFAVIR